MTHSSTPEPSPASTDTPDTDPRRDNSLAAAVQSVASARRLLIATDFDGVLAPIVANPADASPLSDSVHALTRLAALADTFVAVVSGRSLDQLADLLAPPANWHLIGSHGAERPRTIPTDSNNADPLAGPRSAARDLADRLRRLVAGRPGVTIETKPVSVAVHVRNAPRDVAAEVIAMTRSGPGAEAGIHVTEGKEVIELATTEVSKGAALTALRNELAVDSVVYVGDDVTDERAFATLTSTDLGLKVGPGETVATHRVPDPESVATFFTELANTRAAHPSSAR